MPHEFFSLAAMLVGARLQTMIRPVETSEGRTRFSGSNGRRREHLRAGYMQKPAQQQSVKQE